MIKPLCRAWDMNNKRVFLRADFNVPLINGTIGNDFRLKGIIPTLDYILKKNGSIVLATHIGRPENNQKDRMILSTRILISWFEEHGYCVEFAENVSSVRSIAIKSKQIILMENLRFFPGEKEADIFFAKELATTAHYYINDAFGVIHHNDCSVAVLPFEFPDNRRSIGFLMEKELRALNSLQKNPDRPFVIIMGGGKVRDKIPLIKHLLPYIDTLFIYPALCFTFLKAMGKPVGLSLVEDDMIEECKELLMYAHNYNVTIIFPQDFQIANKTIEGSLQTIAMQQFPTTAVGISIGPQSVQICAREIKKAGTIFFNGAMGFSERPETRTSTYAIIASMTQSSAKTIIAGGDSVDCALRVPGHDNISHLSTGGGAALAYLSGATLPGLIPYPQLR